MCWMSNKTKESLRTKHLQISYVGVEMVLRRKNQCTINLHNHKRNFKKLHCIYRFWSTKCSDKTPLNLSDSWDQLGLTGAQYRAPLVKSEFFFLCIFTISLERRQLSRSHSYFTILSPRAIHSSEHFPRIALSFLKCCLVTLRHVTSRHVLWQSIYSATRGHPMGTTYHHGWIFWCKLARIQGIAQDIWRGQNSRTPRYNFHLKSPPTLPPPLG